MPVPAIRIQGLTKQRGGRAVLSDLDLMVPEGGCMGLVGVNGAGKTTLLKCLLDLDTATSGEIAVFNRKHSLVAARARLAYLPEKFRPPGYLNGWEFLRYLGALHGNQFNLNRIKEVMDILDVEIAELDKPAMRLSKGTAQKLGLAACLVSGKRLLIMDEPMSGLDPRARVCLQSHLLELKRQGLTCFFTTHLLADAEKLCDSIAILHQGKIHYVGSPAACCRHFNAVNLEQAFLRCVRGRDRLPGNRRQVTDTANGEYTEH